jgi:Uma2 family endonuclease
MKWQELVADPRLQDLPYKIETNEWEQIVMTPARNIQGALQSEIAGLLRDQRRGQVVTESAIKTTQGTKVADVAWYAPERWLRVRNEYESSIAANICVEIVSPANSNGEMEGKRALYFAAGAEEVWVCDAKGRLRFYDPTGELSKSNLVPKFPKKITV